MWSVLGRAVFMPSLHELVLTGR